MVRGDRNDGESGFLSITDSFPDAERRLMFRDNAAQWCRIDPASLAGGGGADGGSLPAACA